MTTSGSIPVSDKLKSPSFSDGTVNVFEADCIYVVNLSGDPMKGTYKVSAPIKQTKDVNNDPVPDSFVYAGDDEGGEGEGEGEGEGGE
jgi:hypothetical protein